MTTWEDMKDDSKARKVLDHGFIALVDHMGNDGTIVQSARVSYGDGTKTVSEDRGLIRYLMRNRHTTPFEMVEFRFLCKMPLFVARQWIRHRTANVNEYSGRYSIMVDEFYVPELEHILPQSTTNNQGRGGGMSQQDKVAAQDEIRQTNITSYKTYQRLLGNNSKTEPLEYTDVFNGIAREMARGVLTVNNYTEWYWKCDLQNIFHFLSLRMDQHAQYEIRVFADAMYELIKPIVPLAIEAFEDYRLHSSSLSRMELDVLKSVMNQRLWGRIVRANNTEEDLMESYGLSKRELREFKAKFNL